MAVRPATTPANTNDHTTAGPAIGAASVRTMKMPVPIVAPMPNSESWNKPIVRASSPSPVSVPVSSVMTVTGLRRESCCHSDGDVSSPSDAMSPPRPSVSGTLSHGCGSGNRSPHQPRRPPLESRPMDTRPRAREDAPMLRGISEIRAFFRTNETPIYFVSPTAFNLLGIDRWLRNFFYVNYFDSFEGNHPRVFVPRERPYREFESMEDVCNYLLEHKEVLDRIQSRGGGGKAVFVMFDDETEAAAAAAGLEIAHPSAELRHRLDSQIVTTQLGNEAGVASAPNTLGRATSYAELTALSESAGLGDDLVVQTPYGDSGKTTFFIRGESDWDRNAEDMAGEELKVMKRINNRALAVEAALTRHGTIVGPLMNDLIGHPELTPHKGGWCGNDIFPDALSPEDAARARTLTRKLGDRLAAEGYRGFLEVDFLVDVDTGDLYLGEMNPRISGITSMTNVTAAAYADIPLFLFHMLEYVDVDYE